jgi:hypothetical protein
MSALGQKRTSLECDGMSALPPKADIGTQSWNVRFVPKADIQTTVGYYCRCAHWGVSDTHPVHVEDPANRNSTWTFRGEHFYIWLLGWPAYRQQLAMRGRKPIRPGRFVSSLAPFRAVLPTSLPA